ncbi:hypothetical protein CPB83DRAFT_548107 [Crepidotus variabilis]|uniref:Uncharacterized protein n=1 Tax=Crepidotus variabilis TaxID=179855 RepID=A0A9P6JM48_9AGAR|nr:hypothetical protein CPB83DRAFT_548107 [Crepidotus variabilis]
MISWISSQVITALAALVGLIIYSRYYRRPTKALYTPWGLYIDDTGRVIVAGHFDLMHFDAVSARHRLVINRILSKLPSPRTRQTCPVKTSSISGSTSTTTLFYIKPYMPSNPYFTPRFKILPHNSAESDHPEIYTAGFDIEDVLSSGHTH